MQNIQKLRRKRLRFVVVAKTGINNSRPRYLGPANCNHICDGQQLNNTRANLPSWPSPCALSLVFAQANQYWQSITAISDLRILGLTSSSALFCPYLLFSLVRNCNDRVIYIIFLFCCFDVLIGFSRIDLFRTSLYFLVPDIVTNGYTNAFVILHHGKIYTFAIGGK